MRRRCGRTSVLSAIALAAVLMAASVSADDSAAESAVSEAASVQETAEESEAESVLSEAESAAESVLSETDSTADSGEAESEAEEPVSRPEYRGLDFITLGDYKGLKLEVEPIEISDEEIDSRIDTDIRYSEEGSEVLEEGTVEEGDVANIDYEGKKDGVAFDGGTAQGYDLEIGSGTFIEGFEEGLVGAKIGDTVDLNLTFPEDYGAEDLAGQDVVFTVKINSVKRMKELDDALAEALSDGEAKTVDEYRDRIRVMLEEDALNSREESAKSELLTMAAASAVISEYPEDLIEYYVNDIRSYYESYAAMYGMDFDTFLTAAVGITEEDFPAMAEEIAEESVKMEFMISAIAETENLLPEGEDLMKAYDELAEQVGYEDGAALIADNGEYAVNYKLAYDAVSDFLYQNAELVEAKPESEAVESETVESEAVESEAVESEAVESEAVESEAVESETAESETVESEAAESEAAQ